MPRWSGSLRASGGRGHLQQRLVLSRRNTQLPFQRRNDEAMILIFNIHTCTCFVNLLISNLLHDVLWAVCIHRGVLEGAELVGHQLGWGWLYPPGVRWKHVQDHRWCHLCWCHYGVKRHSSLITHRLMSEWWWKYLHPGSGDKKCCLVIDSCLVFCAVTVCSRCYVVFTFFCLISFCLIMSRSVLFL